MLMRYWPKILKYLHGNNTIKEQKRTIKVIQLGEYFWKSLSLFSFAVWVHKYKKAFKKSDSLVYPDIYL